MSYSIIQFLNNSMGPILQGLVLVLVDHCVYCVTFVSQSCVAASLSPTGSFIYNDQRSKIRLHNQHVFFRNAAKQIHCGLLSSLRLVSSNAHQALGNYRNDIAYTAALKSTLSWAPVALPQGNYRHDIAYTAALKSIQTTPVSLAQGSYRYDIAYTAALKSIQTLAKGSYRQDIAYTGALKSTPHDLNSDQKTGATHSIVAPVFCFKTQQGVAA